MTAVYTMSAFKLREHKDRTRSEQTGCSFHKIHYANGKMLQCSIALFYELYMRARLSSASKLYMQRRERFM